MEQKADVVLDLEGNAIEGASVEVWAGTGNAQVDYKTPATIYDQNGHILPNSTVSTGPQGDFAFSAPNGKYVIKVLIRGTPYKTIGPLTFYDPSDDADRVTAADLSAPSGADLIGTAEGDLGDLLPSLVKFDRLEISPERFRMPGDVDDGPSIQRAIDYAIANSKSVRGNGLYRSSTSLVIRQYRLDPPVNQDFSTFDLYLNQLTYTSTTGRAIDAGSSTATVHIKKLIGSGGSSDGLYITGQGDSMHRVDWVKGFFNNININEAYSHTVWVGYCNDAKTGIRINGNAIKIIAGRIGGQYTDGDTQTDPTSCDIGIDIVSGVANDIRANIEYCRRTMNSICLRDAGEGTTFSGYLEGANAFNLYAFGRGGKFYVAAGNNKLKSPAAVFAENDNRVYELSQQIQDQVIPESSNTTLTFERPTQQFTYGFAQIKGPQGHSERAASTSPKDSPVNEILYSNNLLGPTWSLSTIGNANWGNTTITPYSPAYPDAGYPFGTRIVLPASPGDSDIYVATQSSRTVRKGLVNFGMLLRVLDGDLHLQIRLLNLDTNRQSKYVISMKASNKWVNAASRINQLTSNSSNVQFDIQFRSTAGATIEIANTFLVNEPVSYFPPSNQVAPARVNIKGVPVLGNTFDNGVNINGVVCSQISPAISSAGVSIDGDYPVTLITGGWEGNLFLNPSLYGEGHRIVVKRDGVSAAASGVMQVLPSNGATVDGSVAPISIAAPYTYLELIWSNAVSGWLKIN